MENRGLTGGPLGLISSIAMGAASTVPAYSLAARLGFIALMIVLDCGLTGLVIRVPAVSRRK